MKVAYDSLFEEFKGRIEVHINPCLLGDPNKAFNLLLGDVLLEYWQELEGTLLCFSHAKPVSNIATIYGAYVHCVFSFRGLSLRPKEKTTGVGRVTRTTDATHIVIQVLGFFNVLMQAKHLTRKGFSYKDEWRGPANETILNELLQFRYHVRCFACIRTLKKPKTWMTICVASVVLVTRPTPVVFSFGRRDRPRKENTQCT